MEGTEPPAHGDVSEANREGDIREALPDASPQERFGAGRE